MFFKLIKQLLFIGLIAITILPAHATLIDKNTYTIDSVTSLEWLDLTTTYGRAYSDIQSEMVVNGEFYGWSFASHQSILDFVFNSTGVTLIDSSQTYANGTFTDFINFLGGFDTGQGYYSLMGLSGDPIPNFVHEHLGITMFDMIGGVSGGRSDFQHRAEDTSNQYVGFFLVRESTVNAVPEPSAIALMGLGLLGFVATRRKIKK